MPQKPFQILPLLDTVAKGIKFEFFKPDTNDGTIEVLYDKTEDGRPATTKINVRKVTVGYKKAVPGHVHSGNEKMYTLQRGSLIVFLQGPDDEGPYEVGLNDEEPQLIIPPGYWHCVACLSSEGCTFEVVLSSKDNDVTWEDATEELLKNEHLATT